VGGGAFIIATLCPTPLLPPSNANIVKNNPGEQRQQQRATRDNKAHAHSPHLLLDTVSAVAWPTPPRTEASGGYASA
jgi:hypothetical protein